MITNAYSLFSFRKNLFMRQLPRIFFVIIFLFVTLFNAQAQQSEETKRGVELYKQGNYKEAIKVLRDVVKRNKADADAWQFLGLSLSHQGSYKDACESFERVVKLRPQDTSAHINLAVAFINVNKLDDAEDEANKVISLDPKRAEPYYVIATVLLRRDKPEDALGAAEKSLSLNPKYAKALVVKNQARIQLYVVSGMTAENKASRIEKLKSALEESEAFLKNEVVSSETAELNNQIQIFRHSYDYINGNSKVAKPSEVDVKARITRNPGAKATDEAIKNGVRGTVRLSAVLSADGRVENIRVVTSLPYGLTESAINSAKQIKFIPAKKDGKPVSQYITLEYHFRL